MARLDALEALPLFILSHWKMPRQPKMHCATKKSTEGVSASTFQLPKEPTHPPQAFTWAVPRIVDLEVEAAAAAAKEAVAAVVVEAIVEVAATEDIMAAVENAEVVMEAVGHLHLTTEVVEAEADPAENIAPDLALIHHVSTLTLKRSLPRFLFHLLSFEYMVLLGKGFFSLDFFST